MVDIDGTLAHMKDRSPFDWHRVGADKVDMAIASITQKYKTVILLSGRDGVCRPETEQWLKDNDVNYSKLFMRTTGDNTPDEIVKWDIYQKEVAPNYDILFVLDDRNKVVKMWRENGLKCLQVAEGDF